MFDIKEFPISSTAESERSQYSKKWQPESGSLQNEPKSVFLPVDNSPFFIQWRHEFGYHWRHAS